MGWFFALLLICFGFLTVYAGLDCVSKYQEKRILKALGRLVIFLFGTVFIIFVFVFAQSASNFRMKSLCILAGLLLAIKVWGKQSRDCSDINISRQEAGQEIEQ